MKQIRTKTNTLTQYSYKKYLMSTFVPMFFFLIFLLSTVNLALPVLISFVFFYVIIYIYGVNIFFHRYWAHKQFKTYKFIAQFFTFAGLHAMIGGPSGYALTHRWHHAHSDTDRDPHSPAHGRWHALIGWTFKIKPDTIPLSVIRDFFDDKHEWLFVLENNKRIIPWITVLTTYTISAQVCLGLVLVMIVTHLIELYINAFLHDVETKQAVDINPVIGYLTAGGLTHKLHHDNPGRITSDDPGKFFVKIITIKD